MNIPEANKIVAKFMGTDKDYLSLDALVPVWEMLRDNKIFFNKISFIPCFVSLYKEKSIEEYTPFDPLRFFGSTGETIQEAALMATATAIQELGK